MTPEWVKDAEDTAKTYPFVPSAFVLRLLDLLAAVTKERDTLRGDGAKVRANLHYTQAALSRIINQLQDCRDTEAAVLRAITEAQERRASESAEST